MADNIHDDGGPAFPHDARNAYDGMSLRDWVAGQCVSNAFGASKGRLNVKDGETWHDAAMSHWSRVAEAAFIAADAMLAARSK